MASSLNTVIKFICVLVILVRIVFEFYFKVVLMQTEIRLL